VGRTVTATFAVVAEGDVGGETREGGEGRETSVKGGSGAAAGVLWPRGRWQVSREAVEEASMRRACTAAGSQREVDGPAESCGSCRIPSGWGASVSRFFRTGCTVLWHSSKNLVEWVIAIPQPFSISGH